MTIQEALRQAQDMLATTSDAPTLDAQRLAVHVLEQPESSYLLTNANQEFTEAQQETFNEYIHRRQQGEPLAYILGHQEFYGRDFIVTPDVLIPRPATEDLIDAAKEQIITLSKKLGRSITIVDIGTGSGCIAITLALENLPIAHLYATDISQKALAVAQENAKNHGVQTKVTFLQGNMIEPSKKLPIDLIVSNPPYIPSPELEQPPTKETAGLRYEPLQALDGGQDGQRYIEIIKNTGIPCVLEVTGGVIQTFNLN